MALTKRAKQLATQVDRTKTYAVTEALGLAKKTATVTFDADKTNATALAKATTDAGFPSTVRK